MSETYFQALNYTMANEDTRLELALALQKRPRDMLVICGSGGRLLPLLAARPAQIVGIDVSQVQLYLGELRLAVLQNHDIDDYRLFFGFPPYQPDSDMEKRREIFLSLPLSSPAKNYFEHFFTESGMQGLLYVGKWENTFASISRFLRKFFGDRYDEIFSFTEMAAQDSYFKTNLARWHFTLPLFLVLLLFGNAKFFNALLYRGSFVKKNKSQSYIKFYLAAFSRLFKNGLARENFFLQLCFLGKIAYPEGNTIDADADTYRKMQQAILTGSTVSLKQADVIEYAQKTTERFDFVSISDVPSYFAGDYERTYMQKLALCLRHGALVVLRCYLRIPEGTDLTGFEDITKDYAEIIALEKMQVYDILIYRYLGGAL